MKTNHFPAGLFAIAFGCSLLGGALCSQAQTIVHRYEFSGNVNDSVGTANGTATSAGTNLEAPQFGTVAPSGASGPTQSIEFGMNKGSNIKSGFSLPTSVVNNVASAGAVSFFINTGAKSAVSNDYPIYAPGGIELVRNWTSSNDTATLRPFFGGNGAPTVFALQNETWYHVAMVWEQNGTDLDYNFYVDGNLIAGSSGTFSNTSIAASSFNVGNFNLTATSTGAVNQFVGRLYDVQVYDGVLDSSQVSSLASNPGSPIPEPSSFALLTGALGGGLALLRRRRE